MSGFSCLPPSSATPRPPEVRTTACHERLRVSVGLVSVDVTPPPLELRMKLIKVAAATLNQTPLDWNQNHDNIVAAIEHARRQQVSLLCLPELCITGYGCEDMFLSPAVLDTAQEVLEAILPACKGMIV